MFEAKRVILLSLGIMLILIGLASAQVSYSDCSVYGTCKPVSGTSTTTINNNTIYQNTSETDPLSLHLLKDNWNLGSNWLTYSNPTLDFNSSKLTTIYYNATQSLAVAGTIDGGTLADTNHQDGKYDGNTFNFSEVSATPGLDLRINFTGITSFNTGIMRYKTASGLTGAYPIIQMWNYNTNAWEDYPPVAQSTTFATITQPVFDSSDHVSGGVAQMRIYKATKGNTGNKYYVDWIAISQGFGTPSGEEVDPYSWHKDGNINATGYNITADYFFGNGSQLTDLPSSDLSNYLQNNTAGGYNISINSQLPITTTGTGTFGSVIVNGNRDINEFAMNVIGGTGTPTNKAGQQLSFYSGSGYSAIDAVSGGAFTNKGGNLIFQSGSGGTGTVNTYSASRIDGSASGALSFGGAHGGHIITSIPNQHVFGGGGTSVQLVGGWGGNAESIGAGGIAWGGKGGNFDGILGGGGSALGYAGALGGVGGDYIFYTGPGGGAVSSSGSGTVTGGGGGKGRVWMGKGAEVGGSADSIIGGFADDFIGGNGQDYEIHGSSGGNAISRINGVMSTIINNGGADYVEGDYIVIAAGDANAYFYVVGVDGSGTVTAISYSSPIYGDGQYGSGYTTSNGVATEGGSGSGLTVNIIAKTADSAAGGNAGNIKFYLGMQGIGSGTLSNSNGNFGDFIVYDSYEDEVMRIYGDGSKSVSFVGTGTFGNLTSNLVNVTTLLKLNTMVLPTCSATYKNNIGANATNIYMCNSTCWIGWGKTTCG